MSAATLWLSICLFCVTAGIGGFIWMLLHRDDPRCKAIWPSEGPLPAVRCDRRGPHMFHSADRYWPWWALNPIRIGAAWPNEDAQEWHKSSTESKPK